MILLWIQHHRDLAGILLGTAFGFGARLLMLRTDYRQYPAYPHGRIIHAALGLIAGALGAVAVPALYHGNYTAITFLSLAAQQFREVRNMERNTLTAIDHQELVPRGAAYIEGIAVVFEGRNYLAIFASLTTTTAAMTLGMWTGAAVGALTILTALRFMKGKSVGSIAEAEPAELRFEGPGLFAGGVYIMNVGLEEDRQIILKQGLGILLRPKSGNARVTIANLGQRQAILHDLSTRLGVYRDEGEPSLVPLGKLSLETGALALFVLPRERDPDKALMAVRNVPLLEAAVRMPTEANRRRMEGGKRSHG